METLLDWLNLRTFTAVAALTSVVFLAVTFQDQSRNWYRRWRYAAQTEKTSLAATIESDLEAKASLKLRYLHQEVSLDISRAVAEGFPVAPLQATADGLLQLDTPALRSQGIDRLQKLRLTIPRKKPILRVLNDEDDEETPTPNARTAPRARTRPR
ncbi:MAG: hypothetical protein A2506_06655 [Elusimicrobia bacterium RIFOXYD12_FULL_66_9]|nr:MAG: hypothetical protein A2506_06655 [Elusimicrobia bacterium RIFOXYD12_FULL_66_9]